ncbi:MAG: AsnC family transcriptional regulator [Schwartzia sp.]|nr:AsnC family transcriptional regulator [Schwartzia sp. (in: firmicutes)]MBR1884943.1 AsnC family transcriptional regulator [Schwartzia sp. (in: firmicutes)]
MLSEFDKAILNAVQEEIPLAPQPFAILAQRLHTDESTVLERLASLKEDGYLRRLGAYFDSDALGYHGTLVALRVSEEKMPEVIECVNRYDGITHNYEREGEYNLWFTLQTPSDRERQEILAALRSFPGVERMIAMHSKKKYKVRVQFHLRQED